MKKLTIIFFLTFISQLNWAADLIVTTSGQTGTYTTLSSALVAANSGDRILISNIITLYENDTIDKSVTILPLNSGSRFIMVGSITVKAEANTEIRIVGMELTGEVKSISGSADGNNLCQFYMIDCEILNGYDINCDVSGLSLNLMYSNLPNDDSKITFRQGSLIANNINGGFIINPGDNVNYNDTTKIIANRISSEFRNVIDNSDHYFLIANNYFALYNETGASGGKGLTIKSSNLNVGGENSILNNTMETYPEVWGSNIKFNGNFSHSNTNVLNNVFAIKLANFSASTGPFPTEKHIGNGISSSPIQPNFNPKLIRNNAFTYSQSQGVVNICNANINNGYCSWDFFGAIGIEIDSINYLNSTPTNSIIINGDFNTSNYFSGTGKVITALIDAGENSPKFYDIDLTRNDLGTYGGPYSWDNYWNTNNGRARIYELDAPFELPPNQTFNIKSSASHNH